MLGILLVRSELGVLFATDTAAASWTKLVYTQQLKQAAGSILLIGIPLGVCLFRHTAALFICFQCLKKKKGRGGGGGTILYIPGPVNDEKSTEHPIKKTSNGEGRMILTKKNGEYISTRTPGTEFGVEPTDCRIATPAGTSFPLIIIVFIGVL